MEAKRSLYAFHLKDERFLNVAAATGCIDVGVFIVAATVTNAYAIIASTGKLKGQQA
ncbi:hypothetical protein CRG98_038894 [Punica granatum]|uniref:Uncharacterized protein n=1 Tax=Punica granatum TaxID=22663 RepID=A0A2I0IA84_PUNGR|nr:hypothetical protein CRG98_038894 [Punica granatum]